MAPHRSLRVDIQVLRAIAVAMVLLFHANIPGLAGGYLGVDIFLVISGYLITGMIARGISRGSFTLSGFYLNRAKRLLPAAYTVYLATGILGLWLLTDAETKRYLDTLWGALTFTANIGLWQSTDYFGSAAKLNVLLHVWSLSLEEQFYFIVPVAMIFIPRRFWNSLTITGFAISLVLCFYLVVRSPVATFYLLPTRAWELMIGAVISLNEDRLNSATRLWITRLGLPALAIVLLVPLFMPGETFGFPHPSVDAFLVCLATGLLIIGRPRFMNDGRIIIRVGYWLGGISYSLYLVHWPLFAFARNVYLDAPVPITVRLLLVILSVLLAAALYYYVERPIHEKRLTDQHLKSAAMASMATLAIALIAFALPQMRESPRNYTTLTQPNYGLDKSCDYTSDFHPHEKCQTGYVPKSMIWGDSFAMHLVRALPTDINPFVQATKSGCAPALGIAQLNPSVGQDERWARDCIRFNSEVIKYLADHSEIHTVLISSPFSQILGDRKHGVFLDSGRIINNTITFQRGASAYLGTIRAISKLNRRIIIISPPPSIGVNMPSCMERREMGLLTLGPNQSCILTRKTARSFRTKAFSLLDRLKKIPGVEIIDLFDILCPGKYCLLKMDGTWLFRDEGHLSIAGSELLRTRHMLQLPPPPP